MKILFLLLSSLATITASAQRSVFSIGVDLAVPIGTLRSSAENGFGASLRFERKIAKHFSAMGTVGYISNGRKTVFNSASPIYNTSTKLEMGLLQTGVKFYLGDNEIQQGLYLSGEAGYHMTKGEATTYNNTYSVDPETHFSYAVGFGYCKRRFEFGYRQQFLTHYGNSINYSGFRLAWRIIVS